MAFYDEMQQIATGLLTEFKQGAIAYVQIIKGTGPDDEPGPSTPDVKPLVGAVAKGVSFKYLQGGLAVASDLQVTHSVQNGVEPEMNGFYEIDGVRYKIIQLIPIPAAGTKVAIRAIIRKGV